MIQQEYTSLIKVLSELTAKDVIKWSKGDSYFSFYSNPTSEAKILIDKYYSIVDEKEGTCVNMTIFNRKDEIIDEIVCCTIDDKENFELLNVLYNNVEQQFNKINSEKLSPILTHITELLQQKMTAEQD